MSNLRHFGLPHPPNHPFLNKKKFTIDYRGLILHYNNEEYCFYKKNKLILKMKFKYNKLIVYENDLSFNLCFYQAYVIYVRLFYQFKKTILNKNEIMRIYPHYKINTNYIIKNNKINIKAKFTREYSKFFGPNMHIFLIIN
jgi:hypothetical protein